MRLTWLFILPIVLAPAVSACVCQPPRSPRKQLQRVQAVFVGTAVEANVGGRLGSYRFRVERSWKGPGGEFVTVSGREGSCSSSFRVGEAYLVYAIQAASGLQTNLCMRTAPLKYAAEDLKALGKDRATARASPGRVTARPDNGMRPAAN